MTQRPLTDNTNTTAIATTAAVLPQLMSRGLNEVIPAPPQQIASTPKRRIRPQSVGGRPNRRIEMSPRRAQREGHCLACHTSNKGHHPHLRTGDCVGFPGRTYYTTHDSDEGRSFHSAEATGSAVKPVEAPGETQNIRDQRVSTPMGPQHVGAVQATQTQEDPMLLQL